MKHSVLISSVVSVALLLASIFGYHRAHAVAPKLTPVELEELVSSVALYPDPLLSIIFPASVFPDQIVDAALLIRGPEDAAQIAQQSWEPSVKSVATYPGVLRMLYERIDWTAKLGEAFLQQSTELRDAVQRLRMRAKSAGNLRSTAEQQVTTQQVDGQSMVTIQPTQAETVYVPQYTSSVYSEPATTDSNYLVPLATFGIGMAMGSAMSSGDDDDDDINVYGYPGGVVWYDDDSVNDWVNNRHDVIRDSQEHRQGMQKERTDFRHDMREDRQNFRQDQIESGNFDPAARQDFRQQQQQKRKEHASGTSQERKDYRSDVRSSSDYQRRKQEAQLRSEQWKSSASDRGWNSSTAQSNRSERSAARSGNRSSAFDGYASRSSTSAYRSRGSSSRASSYSGRSSAARSGGMSRSRGGGGRGGGGRRR